MTSADQAPGSDSPAAGATIPVTLFNEDASPESVIATLALEQGADMVIPFDCADPKVPFMVRGFFVVPNHGMFKWVGNEKPA